MRRALSLALLATAAAAGWFCAGGAHAQTRGVQVSPVTVEIAPERGLSSFRVGNAREDEVAFEIDVYTWSQDDGETVLAPTSEIIVAPSVFLVDAGAEQIVRVGVTPSARTGDVERSYRIIVREMPPAEAQDGGFRLQLELSMPLFVRPRLARGALLVDATRDADGAAAVRLRNVGSARLNLSEAPNATAIPRLPRYLLAGEEIIRPLQEPASHLELLVADGGGPQTSHRFELSHASRLADRR